MTNPAKLPPPEQAPARTHDLALRLPDAHRPSTWRSATGSDRCPPSLRTFVLATIAVPIVIYGLMPRLHKIRARLLSPATTER